MTKATSKTHSVGESAEPAILLAGPRVFLRHPVVVDFPEFSALLRASRELHRPWAPVSEHDPASEEAFAKFLASADTPATQRHLVCRHSDGAIVAYFGLSQIALGAFCSSYMGYWTGAPFVRRGYATEAMALTLERAFTQLGLHRVEANIIPDNVPSLALARRCGLRREGYSPRYMKIAGAWRDHERWAITIEDWRPEPESSTLSRHPFEGSR